MAQFIIRTKTLEVFNNIGGNGQISADELNADRLIIHCWFVLIERMAKLVASSLFQGMNGNLSL